MNQIDELNTQCSFYNKLYEQIHLVCVSDL